MNSKTKVFKLKTINEMRKENELKPIEGGDIIPIHHVNFTNLNEDSRKTAIDLLEKLNDKPINDVIDILKVCFEFINFKVCKRTIGEFYKGD